MGPTLLLIALGVLAVIGVFWLVATLAAWRMVRRSPHHGESNRLARIVMLAADRRAPGATVALAALDDLLTLARRHPAEPIVQADFFGAATSAMAKIPDQLSADQLEGFIEHAGLVIGAGPGRLLASSIALFLTTLGASRAHTAVARSLHERLARQWRAFRHHDWPNPHEPPARPAPYRR